MSEENKIITPNLFEMQLRVKNCNIGIKKELDRWNCSIGPRVVITVGGIQCGWEVIPNEVFDSMKREGGGN